MGRGFYSYNAVNLAVALAVILATVTHARAAEPTFVTDLTNRVQIGPPTCENVRRTFGHTRAAFCLYLEGDAGRYPYANFIRSEFLADTPALARQVTAVHLSCYKDQRLDQSFFQVLAPSRKVLNAGGGFDLRIGCDQSFLQLKRRIGHFTRVLHALQPFARESLAQALGLATESGLLRSLQQLLSGELNTALATAVVLNDMQWNVLESNVNLAETQPALRPDSLSAAFARLRSGIDANARNLLFVEAQRLTGKDIMIDDNQYYLADTPARRTLNACTMSETPTEVCLKEANAEGEIIGIELKAGNDGPMLEYYDEYLEQGTTSYVRKVLYRFQEGLNRAVEELDFFGPKIEFELDPDLNRKCIVGLYPLGEDDDTSQPRYTHALRLIQELEATYPLCPPAR